MKPYMKSYKELSDEIAAAQKDYRAYADVIKKLEDEVESIPPRGDVSDALIKEINLAEEQCRVRLIGVSY